MEEKENSSSGGNSAISFEKGDDFLDKLTGESLGIPHKFIKYRHFKMFYFWLFYFYIISCFCDIYLYVGNYNIDKEKINSIIIFYGRILSDILIVIPDFLFAKKTASYFKKPIKTFFVGLLFCLPQLILNIISIYFYFIEEKSILFENDNNYNSNEKFCYILFISTIINSILNLLCSFFSMIKICLNI